MQKIYKFAAVLMLLLHVGAARADGMDSRIRTFIYGDNDIFRINTTFGYQTVVELDPKERIITISMGNPNIFRIIPSQNRLFIKAQQNDQTTNMTIVTDLRSYQFELSSTLEKPEDMMYLVKFTYPEYIQNGNSGYAQDTSSRPMDLYSPISLPSSSSVPLSAGSMPSTTGLIDDLRSSGSGIDYGTPLSMQYKEASQEKNGNILIPKTMNIPSLR